MSWTKEERAAYMRAWRLAHPNYHRARLDAIERGNWTPATRALTPEQIANKRERKAEQSKAGAKRFRERNPGYHAKWRAAHPGHHRTWKATRPGYDKDYYWANREVIRARAKQRYVTKIMPLRQPRRVGPPVRLDPEHVKRYSRIYRAKLGIGYVKNQLVKRSKLKQRDMPLPLAEVRRVQMLIHRKLREIGK